MAADEFVTRAAPSKKAAPGRRLGWSTRPHVPRVALAIVMTSVFLIGLGIVPPELLRGRLPAWACSVLFGGIGSTCLLGAIVVYVECSRPGPATIAGSPPVPEGSPAGGAPGAGSSRGACPPPHTRGPRPT